MRGYLENNRDRLCYAVRLAEGRVIGSGQVEGACKNLIGKRLKQTWAEWKVDRLNRMATICTVRYGKHTQNNAYKRLTHQTLMHPRAPPLATPENRVQWETRIGVDILSETLIVGTKKTGKGRRKIGRKKRRMRSKIRHRKD